MLTIMDLDAELAKLRTLRGRTPETTPEEREGAFARLAPYRDSAINLAKFSGEGPWERHPNGDEIVHIVDGAVTFQHHDRRRPAIARAQGRDGGDRSSRRLAPLRSAEWGQLDDDHTSAYPASHIRNRRSANPRITCSGDIEAWCSGSIAARR